MKKIATITSKPTDQEYHYFLGGALVIVYASLWGLLSISPSYSGTVYITLHLLATILMVLAWYRQSFTIQQLLFLGIILRLILFPMPMITSNDMERYLWDGAVTLAGFDPYTLFPDHPDLAELRKVWPTPAEHSAYPTLYPPVALSLFTLSALAGPAHGVMAWKLVVTLASILSLFAMRSLLELHKKLHHFPLFALSPLLIMEGGIGGHVDVIMVLPVLLALLMLGKQPQTKSRHNALTAGGWIAIAAGIKLLPIILLGPAFLYLRPKAGAWMVLATLAVLTLIYGSFYFTGKVPVGSLPVFLEKWRGGAPLYWLLETFSPAIWIPWILGGVTIVLLSISAWLSFRAHLHLGIMIAIATPLLISPIVFPWYLCVLTPFLALRPNFTLFTAVTVVPFGYEVLNGWLSEQIWSPALWPILLTGSILLISLVTDLTLTFKLHREKRSTAGDQN